MIDINFFNAEIYFLKIFSAGKFSKPVLTKMAAANVCAQHAARVDCFSVFW